MSVGEMFRSTVSQVDAHRRLNDLLRELDRQNHREILHHFSISNKRVYHDYYNPLFGSRRSSEERGKEIRKNHPELEVEPGPLDPEEKNQSETFT